METHRSELLLDGMSRQHRLHMPGLAFHITARTQGREPWFTGREATIQRYIKESIASSDAMLLAHAVMPNHFHIVLRQGTRPLGWVMHPIMRRTALFIQAARDQKGHVFERRFRSVACADAHHLRRAIVYTNINPRRAQLCNDLTQHPWCSHSQYILDKDGGVVGIEIVHALKLFGDSPGLTLMELSQRYAQFVEWRLEKDRHDELGVPHLVSEPKNDAGDRHFAERFSALPPSPCAIQKDLRDRAIELLKDIEPNISLNSLRRRNLSRPAVAIRRQLIAGLVQADYRRRQIADFLCVSDSTVSAVACAMRYTS